MLDSKVYWQMAEHTMRRSLCVCLLGNNLNDHAKPEQDMQCTYNVVTHSRYHCCGGNNTALCICCWATCNCQLYKKS
jgi:hypothetical protein